MMILSTIVALIFFTLPPMSELSMELIYVYYGLMGQTYIYVVLLDVVVIAVIIRYVYQQYITSESYDGRFTGDGSTQ